MIERRELAPLQELIEKLTAKEARWNFLQAKYEKELLKEREEEEATEIINKKMKEALWNPSKEFLIRACSAFFFHYIITVITTCILLKPQNGLILNTHTRNCRRQFFLVIILSDKWLIIVTLRFNLLFILFFSLK